MTTKQLAKELGLIRRSKKLSANSKDGSSPKSKQFFQYLIIIDFESTCWKESKHYGQEIIEFPAVLLNTVTGQIESEFHTYVQPQEHPILSDFCTELTGIKQQQVDEGVPLKICLSQFSNWIQKLQNERGIIFPSVLPTPSSTGQKMCAFVTWSDWDLGVCLLYECKRKQLRKPDILNSWIDLRLTYKMFYSRKPKGLNGALQDVGIEFSGREHSGLDDSRNTARLAWRMICDGCVMKITKSLEKVQPRVSSAKTGTVVAAQANGQGTSSHASAVLAKDKQDFKENQPSAPSAAANQIKLPDLVTGDTRLNKTNGKQLNVLDKSPTIAPQTLINGLSTTLGSEKKYSFSSKKTLGSLQRKIGTFTSTPVNESPPVPNHVLFSTTIVSVNDISDLEQDSCSDLSILADWEEAAVIEDSQEDDAVSAGVEEPLLLPVDSPSCGGLMLKNNHEKVTRKLDSTKLQCRPSNPGSKSVVYRSPDTTIYGINGKNQASNNSTFKLPSALGNNSDTSSASKSANRNTVLNYFPKRKLSSVSFYSPPKKMPFTVHEDQGNRSLPVSANASRPVPRTVLNATVNLNTTTGSAKCGRITAPMCSCGRRAKKLTVSNGGPNQGRVFYSCAVRKRDDQGKGCNYFKWEDTLLKEKSANSSLVLSTSGLSFVSNTTLNSTVSSESNRTFKIRPSLRT